MRTDSGDDRLTHYARPAPCFDQTREEIERYYWDAAVSEPAAVRQMHGGFLVYHIEAIQGRRPRVGKVEISRFGDFYI